MRICSLFSGGKDSTYALHWALLKGFQVVCLLTLQPRREDSWMFHRPGVELTKLQAKALDIPLIYTYTSGVKDRELEDLKHGLKKAVKMYDIEGIVTGALLSDYQRMAISMLCEELGLKTFSPLWRKNQEEYMRALVREGFKFIITSINTFGLSSDFIGKIISHSDVENIIALARKYGFNPAFEGGEAETLVLDAPLFKKSLKIEGRVRKTGEYSYIFEITTAELVEKGEAEVKKL